MIPKVRRWRVCARDESGRLLGTVYVDTINRRFARWIGRDKLRGRVPIYSRITASPAPKTDADGRNAR